MIFVNSEVDSSIRRSSLKSHSAKKSGVEIATVDPRAAFDDNGGGASPVVMAVLGGAMGQRICNGGGSFHQTNGSQEFATLLESAIGPS